MKHGRHPSAAYKSVENIPFFTKIYALNIPRKSEDKKYKTPIPEGTGVKSAGRFPAFISEAD